MYGGEGVFREGLGEIGEGEVVLGCDGAEFGFYIGE